MGSPRWVWVLIAFFFIAGAGLALWEETSWIWIGQIWMAVAVLLALLFIALGNTGGSRGGAAMAWSPKPAGPAAPGANTTAKELEHLEKRRRDGGVTEEEYLAERDRILAQV